MPMHDKKILKSIYIQKQKDIIKIIHIRVIDRKKYNSKGGHPMGVNYFGKNTIFYFSRGIKNN